MSFRTVVNPIRIIEPQQTQDPELEDLFAVYRKHWNPPVGEAASGEAASADAALPASADAQEEAHASEEGAEEGEEEPLEDDGYADDDWECSDSDDLDLGQRLGAVKDGTLAGAPEKLQASPQEAAKASVCEVIMDEIEPQTGATGSKEAPATAMPDPKKEAFAPSMAEDDSLVRAERLARIALLKPLDCIKS